MNYNQPIINLARAVASALDDFAEQMAHHDDEWNSKVDQILDLYQKTERLAGFAEGLAEQEPKPRMRLGSTVELVERVVHAKEALDAFDETMLVTFLNDRAGGGLRAIGDIADHFGCSKDTAKTIVDKAIAAGLVVKEGEKRGSRYRAA